MKCHYEYKNHKFNELNDLYPIILGEIEANDNVVDITSEHQNIIKIKEITNNSPIKEVSVKSFSDFIKDTSLTDEDKTLAETSINSGDLLIGKDFITSQGVLTIKNFDERSDKLFTLYKKDDDKFLPIRKDKNTIINIVAANYKYQNYLSSILTEEENNGISNISEQKEITIPQEHEIEDFMKIDYKKDNLQNTVIERDYLSKLKQFGYSSNQSSYDNIKAIVSNISLISENPIKRHLATRFLENIEKFKDLEVILDDNLSRRGVANIRQTNEGDIMSIRINPTLINSRESYVETILEELVHSVVVKETRNTNSEYVQNLKNLHQQVIDYFGKENLIAHNEIIDKLQDLKAKQIAGIELTEEEKEFQTINNKYYQENPNIKRQVYRLNNFDEFIAGILMDSKFQNYLNNIKETDTNKTLWQKFINIVAQIVKKFGIKSDGLLKYALNDALFLVKDSFNKTESAFGKSLNGKYTRSKSFVYNKLGLVDDNKNLLPVKNGQKIANFINTSFNNLVAIHNPENSKVEIFYRDELNKDILYSIEQNLNSYDPVGDALFGAEMPEFFESNEFFDSFADQSNTIKQFNLQTKVYAVNLNDRLNSLYKSKKLIQQEETNTNEELNKQFAKLEQVNKEIDKVKSYLKRLTKGADNKLKSLVDLAYQGSDELDNVSEIISNNMNSSDIKYALQTVKFWTSAKKQIFTPSNYLESGINTKYSELEEKANKVLTNVLKALDNYVLNDVVKKNINFNGTVNDLAKEFVDVSTFRSLIDDLGVTKSTLLNAIALQIKKQNEIRQQELTKKLKHFEEVTKKALPSLNSLSTNKKDTYEIFRQVDNFGRNTRNLVMRSSYAYQQARKTLNFVYNNKSDRGKEDAYNAINFLSKNTEQVDYSVLFPLKDDINEVSFNNEYNRLKSIMGEQYFNEWFSKQSKKIDEYKQYRNYKIEELLNHYKLENEDAINNHQEAKHSLDVFEEANSPYLLQSKLEKFDGKTNPFTLKYNYQSFKYIEDIPKKEISVNKNGKEEKISGYDDKFKQIESNSTVYEYYNEMLHILKDVGNLIPYETGEKLAINGIPEFKLEMYDTLLHSGMKAGIDAFKEELANNIRTEKFDSKNKEIDIITGKEKKNINLGISSSNTQINNELHNRILKYKIDNNTTPSTELIDDWRSEITAKYANEMDFDLSKVLQRYITLGMAYKHKSILEDSLILSQEMFKGLKEYERDNKGEFIMDVTNTNAITFLKKAEENSFINSKKMLEHTINSVLFGDTRNINSSKKKHLTSAEKRHKIVLENIIEEAKAKIEEERNNPSSNKSKIEELENGIKRLQNQIDNLGAYVDNEKLWDLPLKWTQYKGMGWNVIGGIANMTFGLTSNLIEAAGEEFYTEQDLAKAYGKVLLNSSVRNATFNKYNRDEALKIRALMDNYDIMAESGSEYKSLVGKDITEKLQWLSAFNVNARTEYVNQAPLMLVVFDKTKFEHNGKEYSLYEGFDNNGEWNTSEYGEYPEELVRKAVLKTKALVQRNHGNYNPMAPILAKRSSLGRLLLQFRTWMLDGVRTRFFDKDGRYDPILDATVKGRYISAYDIFKTDFGGASKALALQVLRNFIPFKNSILKNSSPLEKLLNGDSNIKDYDVANMKRLAMELNIFIGMYTAVLALRLLAGEWDDDDPKKYAVNLLLNQGTRLRTDILMYISPVEAKKLIQDPIPSMKILSDFYKFKDAVTKTVIDGSPEYEAGVYEGQNRIFRTLMLQFPVLNKASAIESNLEQDFGN